MRGIDGGEALRDEFQWKRCWRVNGAVVERLGAGD